MPASQAAAILAFSGAIFYAALAGFSIPTQRALIMLAIAIGALMFRRPLPGIRTLLYALVAVVLFDPAAVLSAGFWLSFSAVAAMFYALMGRIRPSSYLLGAMKVQWFVTVSLLPLLFTWGMGISLLVPLINFIAVPVFSFLFVPLSLLAVVFMELVPPAGVLLLHTAEQLLSGCYWVLDDLGGISWLFYRPPASQTALKILSLVGIGLVLTPMGLPGKWSGMVLLAMPFFWSGEHLTMGEARFTSADRHGRLKAEAVSPR